MANELEKQYIRCLAATDNLETYWRYHQQCHGHQFGKQCHQAAVAFFMVFDKLPNVLRGNMDLKEYEVFAEAAKFPQIIQTLRTWADNPGGKLFKEGGADSFVEGMFISSFFSWLKAMLFEGLGLTLHVSSRMKDGFTADQYLKWRGHLPQLAVEGEFDPDVLMEEAGGSPSIVVVGDIRRSQDVMTYATTPAEFGGRINTFIDRTRKLLDKHGGVFDKFTGDGFVAYFNNEVCNRHVKNRNESFLGFMREYLDFSVPYFAEWKRHLKKLPSEPIGLAIGADLGRVSYQNFNYHLVAVGEPIVWASRMASAAKAGEILINNLLYEEMRKRDDVAFEEHQKATKSGEGFMAWSMSFSNQASKP